MNTTVMQYTPAGNITGLASAAVSAGTFVQIAADMDGRNPVVKPAAADAVAFGVAAFDAAAGDYVTIYRVGIYDIAASGTIAAGDPVSTAASGKAAKAATGPVVGQAISKAVNGMVTVALN